MKRIFPDVIEIYNQLGSHTSIDDFLEDKIYQEYVNRLPTIQEYFRRISNKKAIEAGVRMGILSSSRKSANKKKIIILRRIMNLFRTIPIRQPNVKDPAPNWNSIIYGFYGKSRQGCPTGVWLEYWCNPLEVMAGTKLDIQDDNPYLLAIAIADYYRKHRWEEFCEFSKKDKTCCMK
ncbi:MAG: hypothetical protein HDS71_09865 [Bacteroidales bacterium]|nr:hypothetical protein [Bacteroidales bacterium]MBD5224329.1 hypothetical protein [Bacteroidales bacterium]